MKKRPVNSRQVLRLPAAAFVFSMVLLGSLGLFADAVLPQRPNKKPSGSTSQMSMTTTAGATSMTRGTGSKMDACQGNIDECSVVQRYKRVTALPHLPKLLHVT